MDQWDLASEIVEHLNKNGCDVSYPIEQLKQEIYEIINEHVEK